MAADRHRVTLFEDVAAVPSGDLRIGPVGTLAWVGSIDEIPLPPLAPTASDLVDAGRRSGEARRLFLARRGALRRLVARRLEVQPEAVVVGYDSQGAPRVHAPSTDVFVSVSGRGPWAGLASAPRPVGIDIEPLNLDGGIVWAVLTSAERGHIEALPPGLRARAFLEHWTAKEAYLKSLGTGLMRDPAEVTVCRQEGGAFAILDADRDPIGEGAFALLDAGTQTLVIALYVWSERT